MIVFHDTLNFSPCYTPVEMFELGVFGGSYFKIKTDLPNKFLEESKGLNLFGNFPDKNLNRYNVLSGSTLEWWTSQNLINSDDPNGWVEWYVKFYYGRRHHDDARQISRFKAFVTRHLGMIRAFEVKGKDSLKTKQNLLQWAWNYEVSHSW
jgi:hypothetical protein